MLQLIVSVGEMLEKRCFITNLKILNGALPLSDLVDVLKAPFSLIYKPGNILHGIQSCLHIFVVPKV